MAKSIMLRAPQAVTSRVPFVVTVDVQPVTPGRRVTVALDQKRGEEQQAARLDVVEIIHTDGDTVFASFQITMRERGTVMLFATAQDDAGVHFHPDVTMVEVL